MNINTRKWQTQKLSKRHGTFRLHNGVQSSGTCVLTCRKRMLSRTGIKRFLLARLARNAKESTLIPYAILSHVGEGRQSNWRLSLVQRMLSIRALFDTPRRRCVKEARRAGHVLPARSVKIRAGIRRPFRLRDLALYGERSSLTWRVSPNQG